MKDENCFDNESVTIVISLKKQLCVLIKKCTKILWIPSILKKVPTTFSLIIFYFHTFNIFNMELLDYVLHACCQQEQLHTSNAILEPCFDLLNLWSVTISHQRPLFRGPKGGHSTRFAVLLRFNRQEWAKFWNGKFIILLFWFDNS